MVKRRIPSFWLSVCSLIGVACFAVSIAADPAPTDPISQLYVGRCASCHGSAMTGGPFGPSLKGADFRSKWEKVPPTQLIDFITANMPKGNGNSLPADDYRQLAAFILKANGLADDKAGASAIRAAQGGAKQPRDSLQSPTNDQKTGLVAAPYETFHDAFYRRAADQREMLLRKLTPVTDQMLQAPDASDWLVWRGTQQSIAYSSLAQINRHTVSNLRTAWAWSLPAGANQIAPLVHDGVMFVASGNEVQALNAADGTLLWRYVHKPDPRNIAGISTLRRSIAIYRDKLYVPTADRHVVALDMRNGRVVWDKEVVPASTPGVGLSAGPTAVRGKIIQGTSFGPFCVGGCWIVALDAETGQEIWRFNTIARSKDPGGDTWNGAADNERSGGAVWVPGTYDPETNLYFVGTAGTYNVGTLLKPHKDGKPGKNSGLYLDSTLAINPDTGRLVWYHQHFPREAWDLDEAFERSLVTLPINGVRRPVVMTMGKAGILDVLDRKTGAYIFSIDSGLSNLFTGVDPATGKRMINPAAEPKPGKTTSVCPSPEGVRNWMSTAFDPRSQILYIPMEETCMDFVWRPNFSMPSLQDGSSPDMNLNWMDISWSIKPRPNSDGMYGRIEAFDLATRKSLWVVRNRAPLSSSLLATAGDLVFAGNRDRMFRALDARSGETLWEVRLNAVPNASPVMYSVNGTEFMAIVSGGGAPHDQESVEITPEIEDSAASTTIWVFSLPKS